MTRRVLIARQDSLGDVLLCGPAIRAVAASGAHVTLLCGPRGRAAAELLPGVDEVLQWRADWIDARPQPLERAGVERFVELIAARRLDEALIVTSFHQSPLPLALLLRMAAVPRIGAISDDYAGSLLDVRHRVPGDVHEVQRALSLARACGYEPAAQDERLRLRFIGEPHPAARELSPYVLVHPGASVSARAWPAQRHAELVRMLVDDGWNVVISGSASERPLTGRVSGASSERRPLAARAGAVASEAPRGATGHGQRQPHPRVLDLGGAMSLEQLAATIAGARAIVVGNTGPAHLAAAVGTPVLSLYAPTVPAVRWRPWGVPYRLLQREVACAGCRARACPVPSHPCMEDITAEEAVQALRELVGTVREADAPTVGPRRAQRERREAEASTADPRRERREAAGTVAA